MAESLRSSKRRRINPPEDPPASTPQSRKRGNAKKDIDLDGDTEATYDSPSTRRGTRSNRRGNGSKREDRNDAVSTPQGGRGRKLRSEGKSGEQIAVLSELIASEPTRTSARAQTRRERQRAAMENTRSGEAENDDDELADGGISDAERQLLMEAAVADTPTKRKLGRSQKNRSQETTTRAGPSSDLISPHKRATPNHKSRETSTSLRRKFGVQRRTGVDLVGDHETEDELQKASADELVVQPEAPESMSTPDRLEEIPLTSSKNNLFRQKQSTLSEAEFRQFEILKNIVLEKLSEKRQIPLTGLDEEYRKVYQLVEATVTAGESNSMLLIGARGSGKTALVNKVIHELSKGQKDDFHVIRLNGFIHTDDKLALREIWRQLGREMEVEEDEGKGLSKSYADTLAVLLSLLSYPSESQPSKDGDAMAKSVVFVMDEFDLFASHPRQTLLYNLLDIAQSRKAPIAVLGLTTRIDVSEGLEKRVKSRFSHRYVHIGLPRTLSAFANIVKSAVGLETEELRFDERTSLLSGARQAHASTKNRKGGTIVASEADPLVLWNVSVAVSTEMLSPSAN